MTIPIILVGLSNRQKKRNEKKHSVSLRVLFVKRFNKGNVIKARA